MLLENSFHSLCYFLSAWIDELLFLFHISVDQTGVELFLFASSFLPEDVIFLLYWLSHSAICLKVMRRTITEYHLHKVCVESEKEHKDKVTSLSQHESVAELQLACLCRSVKHA